MSKIESKQQIVEKPKKLYNHPLEQKIAEYESATEVDKKGNPVRPLEKILVSGTGENGANRAHDFGHATADELVQAPINPDIQAAAVIHGDEEPESMSTGQEEMLKLAREQAAVIAAERAAERNGDFGALPTRVARNVDGWGSEMAGPPIGWTGPTRTESLEDNIRRQGVKSRDIVILPVTPSHSADVVPPAKGDLYRAGTTGPGGSRRPEPGTPNSPRTEGQGRVLPRAKVPSRG